MPRASMGGAHWGAKPAKKRAAVTQPRLLVKTLKGINNYVDNHVSNFQSLVALIPEIVRTVSAQSQMLPFVLEFQEEDGQ
jgi:hypothetical protein